MKQCKKESLQSGMSLAWAVSSKADETFVIVETLICPLQIIQLYFHFLEDVAFL